MATTQARPAAGRGLWTWVGVAARLGLGGVWLVLGLLTRVNAGVSCLLLVAFIIGLGSAWARGLQIECGCFGGGGGSVENATQKYPWEIARDVGLLVLSAWLVWRPRTPWAVDNRLLPEAPAEGA